MQHQYAKLLLRTQTSKDFIMDTKTSTLRAIVATVVFIIVAIIVVPSIAITPLQIAAVYCGFVGWIVFAATPCLDRIPLCVLVLLAVFKYL